MNPLLPILLVGLFASAILGLVLHHRFLTRLRTCHVQTWEALGRPTIFRNNSLANSVAVLRFVWRREDHATGDPQLLGMVRALRFFAAVYSLLFVGVVIAFFASNR